MEKVVVFQIHHRFFQRQVLSALGSVAKHSVDLAEIIVEAEVFPDVLVHMAHPDDNVDRAAAVLTREVCKHTLEVNNVVNCVPG